MIPYSRRGAFPGGFFFVPQPGPAGYGASQPCRFPAHLRYSIEALGGDVESCLQHYFHIPVLWGRNGTAPDYLVLVGGLLTK